MEVTFNVEQLNIIFKTFYALTNITISLFDSKMNCITFAGGWQPYCLAVGKNTELHEKCVSCNREHACKALEQRNTLVYVCHAGIIEVIAPIFFDNTAIAYIMLGEFRDSEGHYCSEERIIKTAEEYGLDKDEMLAAYDKLPVVDKEHIHVAVAILEFCIEQMLFGKFLHPKRHMLSISIDEYINNHLDGKITAETLCKQFNIERHALYQILKSDFDDTVQNIINKKRIERAQDLLHNTDMPVYRIAASVGFNDYSYFSQFFKKRTGVSPLQYRTNTTKPTSAE